MELPKNKKKKGLSVLAHAVPTINGQPASNLVPETKIIVTI